MNPPSFKTPPINLLFIQHTTEVSGSLVSLQNLMEGITRHGQGLIGSKMVLCKDKLAFDWHKERGVEAFHLPAIGFLGHCSGCTYKLTNPLHLLFLTKQLLLLPWFVWQQIRFIKKYGDKVGIVHLNSSVLISSALAAKLTGKKLVWHIREVLSEGRWGVRKALVAGLIKGLADKIVCISPFEALQLGPDPGGKIETIYNSLDMKVLDPALYSKEEVDRERKRLGIPDGSKVVLSLGGFNPIKGGLELMEALPHMKANIHLLVAGKTEILPKGTEKTSFIAKLFPRQEYIYLQDIQRAMSGHEGRVHLVGDKLKVAYLMSLADLVYFGGTIPHFPRPVYEAWAMKKAVLGFNINGVRQNITDNVDGILVDEISGEALGRAIVTTLAKEHLLRLWGEKGHEKAGILFDLEKNGQKIMKVYRQVMFGPDSVA